MKKDQAIQLLNELKGKVDNVTHSNAENWISLAASYVKAFFGDNSDEYERVKKFHFWNSSDVMQGTTASAIKRNIPVAKEFVDNCIEILKAKPLYKEPRQNLLSRIPNGWLLTLTPLLLTGIAWVAFIVGKRENSVEVLRLEIKLSAKEDTLSRVRAALHIADSIARNNANQNKSYNVNQHNTMVDASN